VYRPGSVLQNYLSAVAFSCLNQMLLVLLVGAIGVVIGSAPPLGSMASEILLGVSVGSVSWWIVLTVEVFTVRGRLGPATVLCVNYLASEGRCWRLCGKVRACRHRQGVGVIRARGGPHPTRNPNPVGSRRRLPSLQPLNEFLRASEAND
jgi:hypothetical protein